VLGRSIIKILTSDYIILNPEKTLLNNSNKPKLISQAIYNKASAPDKFGTMCLERPLRIFHNLPA